MNWCSMQSVFTSLLMYMPMSSPCSPGCVSCNAVVSYFMRQRSEILCVMLRVANYMSTWSCLDHYRNKDCPHAGHKPSYGGNHFRSGMLAVDIPIHLVQIGPVLKYR